MDIRIHCGVNGDDFFFQDPPPFHDYLFWSVKNFSFIPQSIQFPDCEFQIIFTSKIAAYIFFTKFSYLLNKDSYKDQLSAFFAVGETTATFVQKQLKTKEMLDIKLFSNKKVLFPQRANGLTALFLEYWTSYLSQTPLIIFTGEGGVTKHVLSQQSKLHSFDKTLQVIEIYRLLAQQISNMPIIIKNALKQRRSNSCFIFECKSRSILIQTVSLLMQYFSITNAKNLPDFILFSTWGYSSENALLELGLIDRKSS